MSFAVKPVALSAVLFILPSFAFAETTDLLWKKIGSWSIDVQSSARPACTAHTYWDDGTALKIGFVQAGRALSLKVENPAWVQNRRADYGLVVQFGSQTPWRVPTRDMSDALDASVDLRVEARDLSLFEELMGANSLSIRYQDNPTSRLPFEAAHEVFAELTACQDFLSGTAGR